MRMERMLVLPSPPQKKFRGIGQFRAAKEDHRHMLSARGETDHQLAPGETKIVPLHRNLQVRLPGENPFVELFRQRLRKIRARLQPCAGFLVRARLQSMRSHTAADHVTNARKFDPADKQEEKFSFGHGE